MRSILRLVVGAVLVALVGVIAGYLVGLGAQRRCERQLTEQQRAVVVARQALEAREEQGEQARRVHQHQRALLRAKQSLLWALVELSANNFGLSSQHLGAARTRLKQARESSPAGQAEAIDGLAQRIASVQALAMRLDGSARPEIRKLLERMQALADSR